MKTTSHATPMSRGALLSAGAGSFLIAAAAPAAAAPASILNLHDLEGALHRTARHKTLVATTKIDRGVPLRHASNAINAFEYTYTEGPGALHVACVLYGSSLFYVANDDLWARYHLFDVLDSAGDSLPAMVHTPQNPFLHAKADAGRDDDSVEALLRRGTTFIACNTALHTVSRLVAQSQQKDEHLVYDDFLKNLVPGVLVVPAGVAAIVLAQEAGYTFLGA